MIQKIYLAGGCFWGVEKYFQQIQGIVNTQVGYANGTCTQPTYELVCASTHQFVECIDIDYEDSIISLTEILNEFYKIVDPVSVNKQGNDEGIQYRSGIYYVNESDQTIIQSSIQQLQQNYNKPIAIEVLPLQNFYPAEEYHQKYLDKNPNGYCHLPKSLFNK